MSNEKKLAFIIWRLAFSKKRLAAILHSFSTSSMMRLSFKDLKVWQKGIDLVDFVYEVTAVFPASELYGLTSQSRRSAVSIPSNIAEGSQRTSDKEFAHFVLIAKGSLAELYTQMTIAKKRGFLNVDREKHTFDQMSELDKMMYVFYSKLIANR